MKDILISAWYTFAAVLISALITNFDSFTIDTIKNGTAVGLFLLIVRQATKSSLQVVYVGLTSVANKFSKRKDTKRHARSSYRHNSSTGELLLRDDGLDSSAKGSSKQDKKQTIKLSTRQSSPKG